MHTAKIRLVLRLESPAFHGGDYKTGSETLFRRLKFLTENGDIIEIPYISGNEIRGQLRRITMRDFLRRVNYEVKSLRLYHSLFSGGVLEESTSSSETPHLDVELRRRIRKMLVPVSLFGFAYRNQVVEGKLRVMHALPICREIRDYLPSDIVSRYTAHAERSIYEYLDWTFHTRHAEEKRVSEEEQAVQMLYRFEVLIPGTLLYTEIICEDCNEVERSCLAHMIELWKSRPFIGGKSSTGYGKVRFIHIDKNFSEDTSLYLKFIEDSKSEIVKLLQQLDR